MLQDPTSQRLNTRQFAKGMHLRTTHFGKVRADFVCIVFLLGSSTVALADQDDWQAARKASCSELVDAYKTTVVAERKVVKAMTVASEKKCALPVIPDSN